MDLYIIRHAWAGTAGDPAWPNDSERPLTPKGQTRFRRVVEVLTGRGFRPELVLTSPLVRCQQTAEIAASVVAHRPQVVPREELSPGSDLAPILSWMEREARQYRRIAWVGHAPDVGHMTAGLIGHGPVWIRFAKGAIAAIRFDRFPEAGQGQLRWLITAKLLGV
jgi:phosphohistidine phosphatase